MCGTVLPDACRRMIESDGPVKVLLGIGNQVLVEVAQQPLLTGAICQVQWLVFGRLQARGHDPRLLGDIGKLMLSPCVTCDALQIPVLSSSESFECVVLDLGHGMFLS